MDYDNQMAPLSPPPAAPPAPPRSSVLRGRTAALVLSAGLLGGGLVGGYAIANAASSSPAATLSGSTSSGSAPQAPSGDHFDPSKGGHTANGITETLLTGETAARVRAAALAAVPGATIQRVETDAEGSPYEAHMMKSDGTLVTVKVDSTFKVTSVENGLR
jgi:hypothetical protein